MDLDDLFRDCYFGDFAVPVTGAEMVGGGSLPIATDAAPTSGVVTTNVNITAATTTATTGTTATTSAAGGGGGPPPPPPPVIAPLVPNNTFYSNQQAAATATASAATTATATITANAAAVPVATPSSSAVTTAKRKAEEALDQATGTISSSTSANKKTNTNGTSASASASTTNGNATTAAAKELTDQQKVERRERNRKHAKRSRLRKKFLLESLQEQINGLQSEIESLKEIIQRECPDKAESLLSSIYNVSGGSGTGPQGSASGSFTPLPMPSGFGPVKALMEPDFRLMSALSGSQQNFAISDPSLPDNPIVYVSQGFLELTGYTLDQVLGRNCRFLQGPGTDQSAVDIIRKGVREGVDTSVCLLNYKADGTPFWNQFFVAALRDAENNVVNFVGVQCEVSKAVVEKQMKQKEAEAEKAQKEG